MTAIVVAAVVVATILADTSNETVAITIIVAVGGPATLAAINSILHRRDRKSEYELTRLAQEATWKRQDEIEERQARRDQAAAEQRSRLAKQNEQQLSEQQESRRMIAALDLKATAIDHKADVTIGLVDGSMTAAMQHELDATKRELVALKRLQKIAVDSGDGDDELDLMIRDTVAKVLELQDQFETRLQMVKVQMDKKDEADRSAALAAQIVEIADG